VGDLRLVDGHVTTGAGLLTVPSLDMHGGTIDLGTTAGVSNLVLSGTITATSTANTSAVIEGTGSIDEAGTARIFNVSKGGRATDLAIAAPLAGALGFTKTGNGLLEFDASNPGMPVTVNAGVLQVD